MIFVGIDALPGKGNGVELVLDSVLDATFIYPTEGDKVVQLAMDILEKKPFERETKLKTAVVDAVNAHVMELQTNHIGELDGKIETLNDRVGIYLSRVATQRIVLYGGLIILLLIVAGIIALNEHAGTPQLADGGAVNIEMTDGQAGGNMEGKESRFGIASCLLYTSDAADE